METTPQLPEPARPETTCSEWVMRFGLRIPASGRVLDLACGGLRHTAWFAGRGHPVLAVDREPPPDGLAQAPWSPNVEYRQLDLETGAWPLGAAQFSAVVVTHYLHRPILPDIVTAVAPGGWLVYETFAVGNERFGRPSRPDFLLTPGELLDTVRGELEVAAYEMGEVGGPRPAVLQRIAAFRPSR